MLIILVGKSGSGKSVVERGFDKTISFTTRLPREGEVHGKDYYFHSREEVEREIENYRSGNESWIKQLSDFKGNYYGTSGEEVQRVKGKELVVSVMIIEGALKMKDVMKQNGVETKVVWVDVDEDERRTRLIERAKVDGDTLGSVLDRIDEDDRDIEKEKADKVIFNNGTVEDCKKQLMDYVAELTSRV